jgi:5-methylcytosine-specific restriction endonuclease McrA
MDASSTSLNAHVLVLNKHYMALRVVSARRAFSMLCRDMAEVVATEDGSYAGYDFETWRQVSQFKLKFVPDQYDWVRTVRFEIAVPRVIRLLFYDRLPKQEVKFNRRNIFARDGNHCQYCGKKFPTSELSLDHVLPRSQGGKATWENLVCACTRCNIRKGGRTPQEAGIKLIKVPVKPKRSPLLTLRLGQEKYASWKQFLDHAYWSVELKD